MTNKDLKEMAARIKKQRLQLGFTQEKFAETINISASSYTKIENAFQKPALDTLIDISEKLDLSLDYIVFGNNKPQKEIDAAIVESIINLVDPAKFTHVRDILDRLINLKK